MELGWRASGPGQAGPGDRAPGDPGQAKRAGQVVEGREVRGWQPAKGVSDRRLRPYATLLALGESHGLRGYGSQCLAGTQTGSITEGSGSHPSKLRQVPEPRDSPKKEGVYLAITINGPIHWNLRLPQHVMH